MRCIAVVVALVACEARELQPPPAAHWTYPPPPTAGPLGAAHVRIGRSQAPQLVAREGITGEFARPLRLATTWAVPGAGPARAIVYGQDGDKPAIELVDVDRGRVTWRDTATCAGPVVGVTAEAVVCTDARGTRAIGLDGKPRWHTDQTFIAMTGERVVVAAVDEAVILDAGDGVEIARVKLPAGIAPEQILASCGDAGRELFATTLDGKLARVAEAKGGPAIAWSVAVGNVAGLDACDGGSVLATVSTDAGVALVAIARDAGKLTGRIDGVRGYWPARDGGDRIEVSAGSGVASWSRDLAVADPVALPVLDELLAKRGELRLVRATKHTAALLDRAGVRAYVPLAEMGAVLGDEHVVAASWLGSAAQTVRRFALPPRWRHPLRVAPPRPGLGVPAELRDLPRLAPLDEARAAARPDANARAIAGVALDRDAVYALAVADDTAGIARFDLAAASWRWLRACGSPQVIGLAVARELVACAARDKQATVRAFGKDGEPRWTWTTDALDALAAGGDAVLAFAADRAAVLDARDGHLVATIASDDGDALRATALDIAGTTLVVAYERGRVVARLPVAHMAVAWSVAVDGVVRALAPAGDGVLAELDDGDAFRIDARTGDAVALPGLDLGWHALGDVIAGEADGEPVPPAVMPIAPKSIPKPVPRYEVIEREPAIAVPWKVPPPGPPAWQYTLFELSGALRARNDYALAPPVKPAPARGGAGSPLVALYGTREAIAIDAQNGDPLRRVQLPDDGAAFSAVVDGKPIAGIVLPNPLRVVLF